MRLSSLAVGLFALLFAGAAQAETWVLIQNPDPGLRRFKMAVRTDNIDRSNGRVALQFLIVEKGRATPQGEPMLDIVWGDLDCRDPAYSNTFLRKIVATGENTRLLKEENYEDQSQGSASLSSAETPVVKLFCSGAPAPYKVVNGTGGDAAVELLKWSAGN